MDPTLMGQLDYAFRKHGQDLNTGSSPSLQDKVGQELALALEEQVNRSQLGITLTPNRSIALAKMLSGAAMLFMERLESRPFPPERQEIEHMAAYYTAPIAAVLNSWEQE